MTTTGTSITVTVAPEPEPDITITFPPAGTVHGSAWLTIDPGDGRPRYSICIAKTDEGIAVEVYPPQQELSPPIASTWAYDQEIIDALAEAEAR